MRIDEHAGTVAASIKSDLLTSLGQHAQIFTTTLPVIRTSMGEQYLSLATFSSRYSSV